LSGSLSGSKLPLSDSINSFANPTASDFCSKFMPSKYGLGSRSSSA
jgi:hypothetical protein